MRDDNIFLLVKPTHNCNLNCEYCYDAPERNLIKNKIINDKTIKKASELAFNCYNSIKWVWHGGEPLLAGVDNLTKWMDIINSNAKKRHELIFAMQSNGTLYNDEFKKLFEEKKVKYSVSYDFINQNEKRKLKRDITDIDPLGKISCINVIDYQSSFKLIDTYEKLKVIPRKISFNKIFLDKETYENIETYTENWIKYFHHYIFDKECIKDDNLFHSIFNKIFGIDKNVSFCAEGNCINRFLCVNPDGDLTSCDRFGKVNAERYSFGNIHDFEFSLNEYKLTKGYENYINDIKIAEEKCKDCDISIWCTGGCKANRVNEHGIIDLSKLNEYDCYFYKKVYNFIFNTIFNLRIDQLLDINPNIYNAIFEEKIMLKFIIEKIKEAEKDEKFTVN